MSYAIPPVHFKLWERILLRFVRARATFDWETGHGLVTKTLFGKTYIIEEIQCKKRRSWNETQFQLDTLLQPYLSDCSPS